ncbi:hypothetical protein [Salmonella enterica]|uniref:hypothetical protein n=1 Tax=Salmonella enterica TaxID=28901 RepID=UPI00315FDCFC
MNKQEKRIHKVNINGRNYKRVTYPDGYGVCYTQEMDNGTSRRVNTAEMKARIDAAIIEADHAEALEMNETLIAPAPRFSIWQRADGMQLAVNAEGTAVYMRPFKQAAWLRAGFEANLEYYWLVEKGVTINETPKLTAYYDDGILNTVEAI